MIWFFRQIVEKAILTVLRLHYFIITLAKRLLRLAVHFIIPFQVKNETIEKQKNKPKKVATLIGLWFIELFLCLLDVLAIGEIYGILADWLKFNSRRLHQWEIDLAKTIYGDSIRYNLITIDEKAFIGMKWPAIAKAYVSFHTVNTFGTMKNGVFIHEMIHIWQYQKFGSPYLLKALMAQNSYMKYDYGGIASLKYAISKKLAFTSFNFEQQGDLVQDYYLIKNGYPSQWGHGKKEDLHYYEHFIEQLKN